MVIAKVMTKRKDLCSRYHLIVGQGSTLDLYFSLRKGKVQAKKRIHNKFKNYDNFKKLDGTSIVLI